MRGALCLFLAVTGCLAELETQPQQVHLAYGETTDSMTITWVTFDPTSVSVVEYGTAALDRAAKGNATVFVDGGSEHRKIYMHRVTLTGLVPGQKYFYHVGSPIGWSNLFMFKAKTAGSAWSPRLAVYGDLGNDNPQSLGRLQEETQKGMYDAILHVGDFAYDMFTDNARVGDAFMRQIESVAAYIPYMTCVGNHEFHYNFSNYKNRFSMPRAGGDGEGMYFSFDLGPAHIISFASELFYYSGPLQIANQRAWLKEDLAKANQPENRAARPWLITMAHRPMYCSNNDRDDCTNFESKVRSEVEDMFYDAGVDLMFWAHEHSYERLWPLYNLTMCNGTDSAPYTNPTGPVHIITGSGGCRERHDGYGPKPVWSAYRSEDYGYTRMQIVNETHLYLEQVSDDMSGEVIDKTWLIREAHGPGLYTCHKKPHPPVPPPKKQPVRSNFILREFMEVANAMADRSKDVRWKK